MRRNDESTPWRLHCGAASERWLRETAALLDALGIRWTRGETIRGRSTHGAGVLPVVEVDGEYFVNPNRVAIERLARSCNRNSHAA